MPFLIEILNIISAKIEGPFLLVGSGLGGLHMLQYYNQYPNEVSGILLVDPLTTGIVNKDRTYEKVLQEERKMDYQILYYTSFLGLNRIATLFGFIPQHLQDVASGLPSTQKNLLLEEWNK